MIANFIEGGEGKNEKKRIDSVFYGSLFQFFT